MRTAAVYVALFVLSVLEIVAGLLAGSAALASLTTEAFARTTSAGARAFARWAGVDPMSLRLRADLAAVLSTSTATEGGSR
ncbi:hypothetical protein LMJ38_35015 [Streptomyces sp. R1]|uniref:hypothetical protein n=1 Tax=Actinomycetes TaxID=1760 RepID=UPI001E4CF60B|nr:hypothetical protein [Streptomyces sp. R1]MCC8341104.1 hypothetical protein [Streptomyces sp. R1]